MSQGSGSRQEKSVQSSLGGLAGHPTRRDLLRGGMAVGVGAALAGTPLVPGAGAATRTAAAAAKSCHGKLDDIEHFVILMQENRSFDQYFGTFPNVRGFDDRRNRAAFKQLGYSGPGANKGKLLPFHLDGRKPIGQCLPDPTHEWAPQHKSWNSGHNNRFYTSHAKEQYDGAAAPGVMGYYEQGDIRLHWRVAKNYTLCDRYFCSVLGPTQPNRSYAISAWLGQDGLDGGPTLTTKFDSKGFIGDFTWETMPERFSQQGVSWKSYTAPGGQFDNIFTCFSNFKNDPALHALGIEPVYPQDFLADLDANDLPQVSFIQVSFTQSEHPGFPPALGEYAIGQVLESIWAKPDIWRKTAVIINYDENGGFFDHMPPPVPAEGTAGEYLTMADLPEDAGGIRGPIGLGFRVPCTVVSPWSRGGLISSKTFDHTSVLRMLESRFGVEVPNLSKWRRKNTNDLSEAFNFAAKPDYSTPTLPARSTDSPLTTTDQCTEFPPPPYPVPSKITMPRQKRAQGNGGKIRRPSGPC
jgi:phospholipase C